MNTPNELKYTKEHEWVRQDSDGTITFGITDFAQARPIQAAMASAASFAAGALMPIGLVLAAPLSVLTYLIWGATLVFLALLGSAGARVGGAPPMKAVLRTVFWGIAAMAASAAIGAALGVVV